MNVEQLTQVIIQYFIDKGDMEEGVLAGDSFADQDLDEIDLFELELFLESEHDLECDVDDMIQLTTFEQLAEHVIQFNE